MHDVLSSRITPHKTKTFHCIYKVVVEPPMRKLCLKPHPLVSRMSVKLQRDFQKGHEKNYHTYSMTVILLLVEEILHQFIGSLSYYLPHFIYIQGGAGFPPSTVPLTTQIHLLKLYSPGCLQARCFTFKS